MAAILKLSVLKEIRDRLLGRGVAVAESSRRGISAQSANVRATILGADAAEDVSVRMIDDAAASFSSLFHGPWTPEDALKRGVQQVVAGAFGRNQLRVRVFSAYRPVIGNPGVTFSLDVYRSDQPVGFVWGRIFRDTDNQLIGEHTRTYLKPSVRGGGFASALNDRLERVYRTLGVRHVRLDVRGEHGPWIAYKGGYQFHPDCVPTNRKRLITGIDTVLGQAGISDAEKALLTSMRGRLAVEIPPVHEIATVVPGRPSVGRDVMAEGWIGIKYLDP